MPEDIDDIVSAHGMDLRHTPLDVLMNGSDQMHREVAEFMEHGEDN